MTSPLILSAFTLLLNLAVFTGQAQAAQEMKVTALSQGSCWVLSPREGSVRVADFNQQKATIVSGHYLSKSLKNLAQKFSNDMDGELDWEKAESFIHCSGHSAFVVMNTPLKDSRLRVCSWVQMGREGAHLASWGVTQDQGFCHGIKPGEYVLTLKKDVDVNQVEQFFNRASWRQEIFEFQHLSGRHWLLKVSFAATTEEELLKSGLFRAVERERLYHPVGESLRIKNPLMYR